MKEPVIILLLEDDPTHVKAIKRELHDFDGSIVIEQVANPNEFFDILKKGQKYTLFIVNYDLPQTNGIEVTRKTRVEYRMKQPIIMLLGLRYEDYVEKALEAGANHSLIKTENYHTHLPGLVKDCLKKGPEVKQQAVAEYHPQGRVIRFVINGQQVEGTEGETILEVATRYGIKIPTLCYHPSVSTFGACRICMVEVTQRGRSSLRPSCVFPISDGLEVKTATERVLKARRVLLELLLARCPDAEILKEMSEELGLQGTRFPLAVNPDKCILCGLCVRACQEVVGVSAISFTMRGLYREIGTPFSTVTEACTGCGECAKICPTNAITFEYIDEKIRKKRKVVAVKCDGCAGYNNRACVINCPTGALEVLPIEEYMAKHKVLFNIELRELLRQSLEEEEERHDNK